MGRAKYIHELLGVDDERCKGSCQFFSLKQRTGRNNILNFCVCTIPLGAIKCCCFAPCGEMFATGSYDHNTIIWDSNTGKEIHTLKGHTHSVETCSFSNNSMWLCTGSWDCSAIIWSIKVKGCPGLFLQLHVHTCAFEHCTHFSL